MRSDVSRIVATDVGGKHRSHVTSFRVIKYFHDLVVGPKDYGRAVGCAVLLTVSKRESGWTPDQIARSLIRIFHDVGILDVRSGVLDDDPEMLEDLTETCDIPA